MTQVQQFSRGNLRILGLEGSKLCLSDFSDCGANWMHESWHVIKHERVGIHQELLGKTKNNILHSVDLSMVVLPSLFLNLIRHSM